MNKTDKVCIGIGALALLLGGAVVYSKYTAPVENEVGDGIDDEAWKLFIAGLNNYPSPKIRFTGNGGSDHYDHSWYRGNSRFTR